MAERRLTIGPRAVPAELDEDTLARVLAALDAVPCQDLSRGSGPPVAPWVWVPMGGTGVALFARWKHAQYDNWGLEYLGTEDDVLLHFPPESRPDLVYRAIGYVLGSVDRMAKDMFRKAADAAQIALPL